MDQTAGKIIIDGNAAVRHGRGVCGRDGGGMVSHYAIDVAD